MSILRRLVDSKLSHPKIYVMASIAFASLVWLMHRQVEIVTFELPLEYRENVDLWRSYLLWKGQNPFSYQFYPTSNSQYGIVYPLIVSWFYSVCGFSFLAPRLVSFIFLFPPIFLYIYIALREKVSTLNIGLIAAVALFAETLHSGNFLAMPNALGMTLFCFAVLLPWLLRFSLISLVLTVFLSCLGVLTKLYFGFGAIYIFVYLIATGQWLKGAQMACFGIFGFITTYATVYYFLPAFIESNILLNVSTARWNLEHLWLQIRYFIEALFGLFLLLLIFKRSLIQNGLFSWRNPITFGFFFFSFLLIKMGGSDGQFYLYFQHLLLPFVMAAVIRVCALHKRRLLVSLFLCLNCMLLWKTEAERFSLSSVRNRFSVIGREVSLTIANSSPVLLDAPLSYFKIIEGLVPDETGQMAGLSEFGSGEIRKLYIMHNDNVREKLKQHQYNYVYTDEFQSSSLYNHDLINRCYQKNGEYKLKLIEQEFFVYRWHPKQCTEF